MSGNTRKEQYEHIELFGNPALFTNSKIDRATLPKGLCCYELRGSDSDPGRLQTIENRVSVNFAGSVIVLHPVSLPKQGYRNLRGGLNFLGESLTLVEFCERHGIELPAENRKLALRPASPDEAGLFYSLPQQQDEDLAVIGHVRIDFGHDGKEFWHTWWPRGREELNSPEFKAELKELVDELWENGPLKNLRAMADYCAGHGGQIAGGGRQNYGYVAETENYRFCLHCNPAPGEYQAYLTAFDLREQKLNMQRGEGLTEAGKQMLQNAADASFPHSYGWFVFRNFNMPDETLTGDLTLPDAIRLYNETDSDNKRLGVTKDGIATVDLVFTLNGEQ